MILGRCSEQKKKDPIDRPAVVGRHHVTLQDFDTLSSLTVGNGRFAFTVDVTGLQTFPEMYRHGVPLGTQSEWGWHSFPNTEGFTEEEALTPFDLEGRTLLYSTEDPSDPRKKAAYDYFRYGHHRLQLGNIGLKIKKKDGSPVSPQDIRNICQELDPWTGIVQSRFTVEDDTVTVITACDMQEDAVGATIRSPLLREGRLLIQIRLPYPTGKFADTGTYYGEPAKHQSYIREHSAEKGSIVHILDTTTYYMQASWSGTASLEASDVHTYLIRPENTSEFQWTILFTQDQEAPAPAFAALRKNSEQGWASFWQSGGAVDFAGSTDPRAQELERRVILSQYLTRAQCAGNFPPQETGLTYNSWYGIPHLEMYWWHAAHFALWGRPELLEKSMNWFLTAQEEAKEIAERQGFKGVRWQKMTDHSGREVPSSVGAFLLWQQPHLIYLAELLYRTHPDPAILEKWGNLVVETADFMASFPAYDAVHDRYNLGKGVIPAQECFDPVQTFNPTYGIGLLALGPANGSAVACAAKAGKKSGLGSGDSPIGSSCYGKWRLSACRKHTQ